MKRLLALAIVLGSSTAALADPVQRTLWYMHGLSVDGKLALVQEMSTSGGSAMHFKSIEVASGKAIADVDMPAIAKLPIETMNDGGGEKAGSAPNLKDPALSADLAAAKMFAPFPLGAGGRIASSKDGSFVAFNVGDRIYTATIDAKGTATISAKPVSMDASYGPWITPDQSTLMFRKWNGKVPGSILGKYELFAMPINGGAGGKIERIDGTAGIFEEFVLTKSGAAARFVVTSEPQIATCVVEVSLAKPFVATKKACLADHERTVTCRLSPTGAWLACSTVVDVKKGTKTEMKFRTRTLEVDANKVAIDTHETMSPTTISDDGLAIVDRFKKGIVIDSKTRSVQDTDRPVNLSSFPVFVTPTKLVVERDGRIELVETAQWRLRPHVE